jgi:hypothetical protein
MPFIKYRRSIMAIATRIRSGIEKSQFFSRMRIPRPAVNVPKTTSRKTRVRLNDL